MFPFRDLFGLLLPATLCMWLQMIQVQYGRLTVQEALGKSGVLSVQECPGQHLSSVPGPAAGSSELSPVGEGNAGLPSQRCRGAFLLMTALVL